MKKFTILILFVVFVVLGWASGCNITIPNIQFCRDKGKFGAVCANWQNAKETKKNVSQLEWNNKRLGMVCASEAGFGNLKAIIEKLCQNKKCIEDTTTLIEAIQVDKPVPPANSSSQSSKKTK